jgi:hypothetical protein
MQHITTLISNAIPNCNAERLATEVVLALASPMNLHDFYVHVYTLATGENLGGFDKLNVYQSSKVNKWYKRYMRYKNPKVQWWFLGYFSLFSEDSLRELLQQIGQVTKTHDVESFVLRFLSFDFASFKPDKLFQYDRKWYVVTIDVAVFDDFTVPVTCEVKLTDEEVLQLAGVAKCKPIQSRHYETNRALVNYTLENP